MAQRADIGSKRLISLAPVTWSRWLTGDESLQDAELLAGEFQWVARTKLVRSIMRWDMSILRESPWYSEILQEGIEQGIEQGEAEMLLHILRHRFGDLPPALVQRIRRLPAAHLQQLAVVALEASALPEVTVAVDNLEQETGS